MTAPAYSELVARAHEQNDDLVLVERSDGRAVVRLNNPSRLNALSAALTVRLLDVIADLARDPDVRVVVLTGEGTAFSAGGDLHLMLDGAGDLSAEREAEGATTAWRWIRNQFGGVVRLIAHTDKPFIAAVNGACAGVGMAFALSCDLVLASERARFVTAFGRIGLVPEVGTSWLLTRRLGYQRAFALFASGRAVPAEEALALGLVNEVTPHEQLLAAAQSWCDRLLALPAHSVAMAKPLLRQAADSTWEQSLVMEEFAEPSCFTTRAHKEAVRAVLEKRA